MSALGPGCGSGLMSDGTAGKRWGQEVTPPGLCGGDSAGLAGGEGSWKRRAGHVEILNNTGVLFTVLLLRVSVVQAAAKLSFMVLNGQ